MNILFAVNFSQIFYCVIKLLLKGIDFMTILWYNISAKERNFLRRGDIMKQNNIGKRIKELREQAKLKQDQVAAYIGVDQSYLSKIESGERSISVEQLERLAELYGCDLNVFDDPTIVVKPLQFALRARNITTEDMNVIATINHIAINSRDMARLLGGIND